MSDHRPKAWIVCYDVTDDSRRRRIYEAMRGYGDHVQYSVFRCVLSDRLLAEMQRDLENLVSHTDDQILLIPLGDPDSGFLQKVRFIGLAWYRPDAVVRIIG